MNRTIALPALMAVAVLGASCNQSLQPRPWNQIHSDKGNTGFNPIHGAYAEALNKKWTASVGKLAFSSPVVGPDGTVYVGNVIGQAVAINPDGTERWRRQLGSSIVATPAVHIETGEILFVVQNPLNARDCASFLYRLSPGGNILAVSTDQDLATTSAPKIWREYVFLQTGCDTRVVRRSRKATSVSSIGLLSNLWPRGRPGAAILYVPAAAPSTGSRVSWISWDA